MTSLEALYLGMVILAFLAFTSILAWVSRHGSAKPRERQSAADADHHHGHAGAD